MKTQKELLDEIKIAPVGHVVAIIISYLGIGPLWLMIAYALIAMVFPATLAHWELPSTIGWVDAFYLHIAYAFLTGDIFGLKSYYRIVGHRRLQYLVGY